LSLAYIYFPETKEKVEQLGAYWEELEKPNTSNLQIREYINDIKDVRDDIFDKVFICEKTGRPFNITRKELEFYRKNSIPLPRLYPDVRIINRFKKMFSINPAKKSCVFCSKEVFSYYPLELGYEKIVCDECYKREVN